MPAKDILISGAGIAGSTLAYWLARHGFSPTIVERSPKFRDSGYTLDFWGTGYDVAEKMNLIEPLKRLGYRNDRIVFVNEKGRERSAFGGDILRKVLHDRFLSIQRGDLASAIFKRVSDRVPVEFGDSIVHIAANDTGCQVQFESGHVQGFDLVIGAGGLHSKVRTLMPTLWRELPHYLGYCAAAFVTDSYSKRDEHTYLSFAAPGRQISRFALRNGRTGFLFVFASAGISWHAVSTLRHQKEILHQVFDRERWIEWPEICRHLDSANDLYFDSVSQIDLPKWSEGRLGLVGDAAYCPSLLAGEGSSLAMAGAYILAGELKRAGGDHVAAFAEYERRFRSFIRARQRSARGFANSFAPHTRIGLAVRDLVLRAAANPLVGKLLLRQFVTDDFVLPAY